ncbi:hypothetical protein [Slackia piriformis]|uniref:hypothetical protein n=1 Tax=Slackia piriformis TaxID=626934 RepID=UPI0026DC2E89|nr:hypothetical protein [Slackia piriformis]MDO5024652.1 hypothetical protein [Slackia piriformis]
MKAKSQPRRKASHKSLRGFREAFAAEAMKGARTAARKTALFSPLFTCLLGLMSSGLVIGGHGPGGAGFNTYGWCWWYTLLLPVAIALVTAGVANIDVRQKFHGIMSAPMRLEGVWHAKVAYAFILVVAANLVVGLSSSVIWLLGGNAADPLASAGMIALLSASSLWMIPAGLFLTMRFGMLCGIAMPLLIQLAAGIACYANDIWWLLPPAAAVRLCSPLAGVAPSGVPLMPGEAFGVVDGAWTAALFVAVAFGVALVFTGATWFAKREVN